VTRFKSDFQRKPALLTSWRISKRKHPELPFPEDAILVAVNNKVSSMERILKNKDNVTFLPFLGGG